MDKIIGITLILALLSFSAKADEERNAPEQLLDASADMLLTLVDAIKEAQTMVQDRLEKGCESETGVKLMGYMMRIFQTFEGSFGNVAQIFKNTPLDLPGSVDQEDLQEVFQEQESLEAQLKSWIAKVKLLMWKMTQLCDQ